jgi:arginase
MILMDGENKRNISLLGIPLGFGAETLGSDLGINAMRVSRIRGRTLIEQIRNLGYELIDRGDVEIEAPRVFHDIDNPKYLAEMLVSSNRAIAALTEILEDGDLPVILGGDHSVAIPTISAMSAHYRRQQKDIGIIWFDAHADINTPETSPTGNLHGMPLATLLGKGHPSLTELGGFSPKLNPAYVAHIGARDVDAGEARNIYEMGLRDNFFTMSDIDSRGMAKCVEDAIAIASAASGGYAVTFDIDMLDPTFAPGSGTLARGGVTYREAHLALEMIAAHGGMQSFEIVEVNPLLDQSNITVELACELVLSALGKTIL